MVASYGFGTTFFDSSGNVKSGSARPPIGSGVMTAVETLATTSLDDVSDIFGFIPVPTGKRIWGIAIESIDMDTGTAALDMDIILRSTDKLGANTDTTLVDTSVITGSATFYGAANQARFFPIAGVVAPDDADGFAVVATKIIVVAATPSAQSFKITVWIG